MAATGLALTALQEGVERVPDSVWHKVDFFCPPEEKEKKRRNSKKSGDARRSSRRDSKFNSSDSEPTEASRRRRKTTQAATSAPSPSDRPEAEHSDPRPADSPKSATVGGGGGAAAGAAAAGAAFGGGFADTTGAAIAAPATVTTPSSAPPYHPPSQSSSNPVTFTNPFLDNTSFTPVNGYSDGPAPERFESHQLPYRGPRHSVTIPAAPTATAAPTMSNSGQAYYPPPQGDDYSRGGGYDPSRYQPSGDYRAGSNAEGAVGNYYGDDKYGARAASADPYMRRGRSSRYGDDSDDDYDRERSHHHRHRSKSRSSRHGSSRERENMREKVKGRFDTSEGALGASVLGAALGGFIGHKFGKGPIATVAGAAVGGLGVNAWEAHRHKDKERREDRALVHSGRRAPSADAIDSRTRRDLEYYGSRADDERGSSRRGGSRYRGGGGDDYDNYSDQGYDSAEEQNRRRRRSGSRRGRNDYDDR